MNQRIMKKKIPKQTVYCGHCPHRQFVKRVLLTRRTCPHGTTCEQTKPCYCPLVVYRCAYLKWTDYEERSLLSEGCKECGISLGNEKEMNRDFHRMIAEQQGLPTHRGRRPVFKGKKVKGEMNDDMSSLSV